MNSSRGAIFWPWRRARAGAASTRRCSVGLRGLFDASRTADETAGKPHPLMLNELMAEFGVTPDRTLMIGDTVHDLQMAARAGCAAVGVSYGAHAHQGLADLNPEFIADSTQSLHDWLLSQG